MLKKDDKVKIMRTNEIGYVERLFDNGERLMVRIPSSNDWPYPHHVYVTRESVHLVAKGKSSSEEALF
jgi:hypothetical protein